MLASPFEDEDEATTGESEPVEREEPEYSFDGFDVAFSDKVMLTPIVVVPAVTRRSALRHDR